MKSLGRIDEELSNEFWQLMPEESKKRMILRILTQTGTAINWTLVMVIIYFIYQPFKKEAFTIIFMNFFVMGIVYLIKQSVKRPRPQFKETTMGAAVFDEWSFPSGHATRSTYIVILMSVYFPQTTVLWILWGIMMVITRLLLGLHYVSDIIFGVLISAIIMLLLFAINWLPIIPLYQYLPF